MLVKLIEVIAEVYPAEQVIGVPTSVDIGYGQQLRRRVAVRLEVIKFIGQYQFCSM